MWWEDRYSGERRAAVVVAEDDVVTHDFAVVGNDAVVDGMRGRFGSWLVLRGGWNGLKIQRGGGLCCAHCRTAGKGTGEEGAADGLRGSGFLRRWGGRGKW